MQIKDIREKTSLSRKAFAEKYEIPYRTIQDWEDGKRTPPSYVVSLLLKAVENDLKALEETKRKIYALEYENKISHEQGYRLLQLAEEGIDIEAGLAGKVEGVKRNVRLSDAIRRGDKEEIEALIAETKEDEEEQKRMLEEHLKASKNGRI